MPNIIYYIDTAKPPTENPVLSQTNTNPLDSDLSFVSGDRFPVTFIFINNGVVNTDIPTTSSASSSFYLAIGDPATTPLTSTTDFFISHSYGVTCSLDIGTDAITGSFVDEEYITRTMQLRVNTPSGSVNKRSYLLKSVKIYNALDN